MSRFREDRFVSFVPEEVSRLEVRSVLESVPERLVFTRTGEESWKMESPIEQDVGHEPLTRLLSRAKNLKAQRFIEPPEQGVENGLDAPRSVWRLEMSSGSVLEIEVGAQLESDGSPQEQVYIRLDGAGTVYVARAGILEALEAEPESYRNRKIVPLKSLDFVSMQVELRAEEGEDLAGLQEVRFASGQWLWVDGIPVSGQTPESLSRALSGIEVSEFVSDSPESLDTYGLDTPVVRVVIEGASGHQMVLLIGDEGPPLEGLAEHQVPRRYLQIEGKPSVYLFDHKAMTWIHHLIREGNRKDAEGAGGAR
jgi:hypothetical protein